MAKTKVVVENVKWSRVVAKGLETGRDLAGSPKRCFFRHFWSLFHFLM